MCVRCRQPISRHLTNYHAADCALAGEVTVRSYFRGTLRRVIPGGGAWVFRLLFVVAGAALLLGCAAAKVTPVRMSQPGDENLSCEALRQEIARNTAAAEDFVKRDKAVENGNIAKGIGSAIP